MIEIQPRTTDGERSNTRRDMKTIALTLALASTCTTTLAAGTREKFTDTFTVDKAELASTGTNRFFFLAPGFQAVFEGTEGGKRTVLTISVLNETRQVNGVETRIVEERESVNGQLVEISRNYFAISRRTSDVFYFGEAVDIYKNGQVTSHEGAWESGVAGAHFGLAMPGTPLLGARYYQELAPKVAMDRAEVLSLSEKHRHASREIRELSEDRGNHAAGEWTRAQALRGGHRFDSGRRAQAHQTRLHQAVSLYRFR
jgi:hypothetical protein